MNQSSLLELLERAERLADLTLALHQWNLRDGRDDKARTAWVCHVDASATRELIQKALRER